MSMLRTTDEATEVASAEFLAVVEICEVPGHESMEAELVVGQN